MPPKNMTLEKIRFDYFMLCWDGYTVISCAFFPVPSFFSTVFLDIFFSTILLVLYFLVIFPVRYFLVPFFLPFVKIKQSVPLYLSSKISSLLMMIRDYFRIETQ